MDTVKIGALIASLRKEQGLTQAALAEKLNISNRTVSKWENGDGLPDISLLPVVAEQFGITVDELLAGERREAAPETEVPERASADKEKNLFQILSTVSLFFSLVAALLGSFTNLYSIWAFAFLFYNHWEIIFDAISFFSLILSGLAFTVGVIRLGVSFDKEQLKALAFKKGALITFLSSLFVASFVGRLADHLFRSNLVAYSVFAVLALFFAEVYIVALREVSREGKRVQSKEQSIH